MLYSTITLYTVRKKHAINDNDDINDDINDDDDNDKNIKEFGQNKQMKSTINNIEILNYVIILVYFISSNSGLL